MASLLSPREGGRDGGGSDPRNNRTQRAPSRLVQGCIVPLSIHEVERPVEEGASAGRGHRQLVDCCIGVALGLQVGLGDAATPGEIGLSDDEVGSGADESDRGWDCDRQARG